jgi:hypothetical protein
MGEPQQNVDARRDHETRMLFADEKPLRLAETDQVFADVKMAPRAGFEPATIRLTVGCSTAELPRNERHACSRGASV